MGFSPSRLASSTRSAFPSCLAVPPVLTDTYPSLGQSLCPVVLNLARRAANNQQNLGLDLESAMCFCMCASAEPGLSRQWNEHSRIARADLQVMGLALKVYPIPSAASFLTSDACDGLCACRLLLAPCQ